MSYCQDDICREISHQMQGNGLERPRAMRRKEEKKEIKQEMKQAGLPINSYYTLQNSQVSFTLLC